MIDLAKKIMTDKKLCNHCLGRQIALVAFGLTNFERGTILKNALVLDLIDKVKENPDGEKILRNLAETGSKLANDSLRRKGIIVTLETDSFTCELCGGIFKQLDNYAQRVQEKLATEDYNNFLIGAKFFPDIIEREDNLRAEYQISKGESIKSEFTRELGKKVMAITGKEPEFETPDITIIVDLPNQEFILEKRSLFISGRYNKFIRTIPQTRWPCWECEGKGCKSCNFTGKKYQESVEEIIAAPVLELIKGSGSKFHGAGREDIDALMLGNGRPFVLEIRNPKIRTVDLPKLEKLINKHSKKKVAVSNLAYSNKKHVQELKGLAVKTQKTYRAEIALEEEITPEKIRILEQQLNGVQLKQQTPTRVLHRRADLERPKTVFEVKVKKKAYKVVEATILGEGGLYIKELISGDEGRTVPSFSSILGYKAKCTKLDVLYLHTKE